MEKELREKFEAILKEPEYFSLNGMLKEDTFLAMQAAYNLGKQELEARINAEIDKIFDGYDENDYIDKTDNAKYEVLKSLLTPPQI